MEFLPVDDCQPDKHLLIKNRRIYVTDVIENCLLAVSAIIFLAVLIPYCIPAYAEDTRVDGKRLLQTCQSARDFINNSSENVDRESALFCNDYITGYMESENVSRIYLMSGKYHTNYCLPKNGVSNSELVNLIINYLASNNQHLELPATEVMDNVLLEYFPCR